MTASVSPRKMRMARVTFALGLALVVGVVCPSNARAQELRYDTAIDLSVTGSALAAWGASQLLEAQLGPSRCRWCEENALDVGVRRALQWSDTATADTISNVLGYGGQQAAVVGLGVLAAVHDDRSRGIPVDLLLLAEATLLSGTLNQLVKYTVGRERPFVHWAAPGRAHEPDDDVSFYSAHTSTTMAAAVATGTVASMRGYRWAPLVWAVGPPLSILTGYLRVAADKHWFTDVLAGALVGAAIGFAVPYLFHRPSGDSSGAAATAAQPLLGGGG